VGAPPNLISPLLVQTHQVYGSLVNEKREPGRIQDRPNIFQHHAIDDDRLTLIQQWRGISFRDRIDSLAVTLNSGEPFVHVIPWVNRFKEAFALLKRVVNLIGCHA
jgi:hypothetical protein